MDLVNGILNWVATPGMIASLLLFYPPYYLFKTCYSFLSYLFPEDLAGKVVLITGASSGIGENLAYQYATKGASLVLVARREWSLRQVADRALEVGAPDVIILSGDVANPDDCNRFVQATVDHYGRLDHLVCNAGIASVGAFQDIPDVTNYSSQLDVNFWGAVQSTFAALPHLKRTQGRIVVTASATGWNPVPRMIFYNAANAALINFFETLRTELGSEVGITIVTPGWIESEMSKGKFLKDHGGVEVDQEFRDAQIGLFPVEYAKNCARAMVQAARQGDRYLTVPAWFRTMYLWRVFAPEVVAATLASSPVRSSPRRSLVSTMKLIAAYLLAHLGGKPSPTAADVKNILDSVGAEADENKLESLLAELKDKDITEVIACGREKFASVPSGGGAIAGGAPAAAAAGGGAAPAAEAKEEKVEEKEESDDDMGFSLFD